MQTRRLLELERDLPGAPRLPAYAPEDVFVPVVRAPRWHWLWY